MKLWLLSQSESNGYDTFDSVVVAAETEEEARHIHPMETWKNRNVWCASPDKVEVELLGEAVSGTEKGIILASFNAG